MEQAQNNYVCVCDSNDDDHIDDFSDANIPTEATQKEKH